MSQINQRIRHQDAAALAQGYSKKMRAVEIASISLFFLGEAYFVWRAAPHFVEHPWLICVAAFLGFLAADFVSGFVHWMADSWGSTELPLLGPALIRPFREHHVDPKAITRHDFIETNGNNCLISLPVLLATALMPLDHPWLLGAAVFMASMVWFVMLTNQFHKWAHLEEGEAPKLIAALQATRLILSRPHHQLHHTAPYHTYYCITTGWLNWPLHHSRFFRGLERVITATSGMVPRADDIGKEAAVLLVDAEAPVAEREERASRAANQAS